MQIKLKRNMSNIDRVIRTIVGLSLITLGPITGIMTTDKLSSILMGVVGCIALFSAVTSHCPLYNVTGMDTYKKKEDPSD